MFKAPDVEVVLPPRFWVVVGASDEFVWTRSVLRGLEFDKVRDRGPTVHGIVLCDSRSQVVLLPQSHPLPFFWISSSRCSSEVFAG